MRNYSAFVVNILALLVQIIPAQARAQTSPDLERQKIHAVSRIYQVINLSEQCPSSKEGSAIFLKTFNQFRSSYPELFKLIEESEYLTAAKAQDKQLWEIQSQKFSDAELIDRCNELASMLQPYMNSPQGRQAVEEIIQLLKK